MSKNKNNIDDLLFRPIVFKDKNIDKLIVIFSTETQSVKHVSLSGKPVSTIKQIINVVDISATIAINQTIVDSYTIQDIREFRKNISIIDSEACKDQILIANDIFTMDLQVIAEKAAQLSQAISAIKYMSGSQQTQEGNLIITDGKDGLAQIVFSTINGADINLKAEDVEKIGSIIMDVVMHNLSIDTLDGAQINKLRAEIEYKIVDSLPANIKAGDININMGPILQEIKKYQNTDDGSLN